MSEQGEGRERGREGGRQKGREERRVRSGKGKEEKQMSEQGEGGTGKGR